MDRTLKHADYYRLKDGRRVVVRKAGKSVVTYATRHAQWRPLEMPRAEFQKAIAEKIDSLRDDHLVPTPTSSAPVKERKRRSKAKAAA